MADQLDEDIKTLKSKIVLQEYLVIIFFFLSANLKGEGEKQNNQVQEEVELSKNTPNNNESTSANSVILKNEGKSE